MFRHVSQGRPRRWLDEAEIVLVIVTAAFTSPWHVPQARVGVGKDVDGDFHQLVPPFGATPSSRLLTFSTQPGCRSMAVDIMCKNRLTSRKF